MHWRTLDLTGQKFGRLTAVRLIHMPGQRSRWLCSCECGGEASVILGNLKSGSVTSCGCRQREALNKTTHGHSSRPEYNIWLKMIKRCTEPLAPNYKHYGGRGISVCNRWLVLENFLADMGSRPEGTTLGREDNEGDYTPDNCRWETSDQQVNNKRTSHYLTHNGKTQTVTQWARELGINEYTLSCRTKKMTDYEALTTPVRGSKANNVINLGD